MLPCRENAIRIWMCDEVWMRFASLGAKHTFVSFYSANRSLYGILANTFVNTFSTIWANASKTEPLISGNTSFQFSFKNKLVLSPSALSPLYKFDKSNISLVIVNDSFVFSGFKYSLPFFICDFPVNFTVRSGLTETEKPKEKYIFADLINESVDRRISMEFTQCDVAVSDALNGQNENASIDWIRSDQFHSGPLVTKLIFSFWFLLKTTDLHFERHQKKKKNK